MIEYVASVDDVESADLDGFFVGWPRRPSPERHLALLRGSSHVVLAREGRRVGRPRRILRRLRAKDVASSAS